MRAVLRLIAACIIGALLVTFGGEFFGALADPAAANFAGGEPINPRSLTGVLLIVALAAVSTALGILVGKIASRRFARLAGASVALLAVAEGLLSADRWPGHWYFSLLPVALIAIVAPCFLLGVFITARTAHSAPSTAGT